MLHTFWWYFLFIFFYFRNITRELWAKYAALEPELLQEEGDDNSAPKFYCNLSGCNSSFKNVSSFNHGRINVSAV